jgi:uncharacterized protein
VIDDGPAAPAPPPGTPVSARTDPSPLPPRAYPTIGGAIGLLLTAGVLILLFDIPVWIMTRRHSVLSFIGTELVYLSVLAAVVYGGVVRSGAAFEEVLPLRRVSPRFLASLALQLVGALTLAIGLGMALQRIWPKPARLREVEQIFFAGGGSLVSAFFVIVLLGPLAEELLFRGLILNGFLKNYPARKAILVSAFLFAVYHVNPWQIPLAFVLGIVLGAWRVGTGSLWPGIAGHVIANALAFAGRASAARRGGTTKPLPPIGASMIASTVLGALILLALGLWLWRRARQPER